MLLFGPDSGGAAEFVRLAAQAGEADRDRFDARAVKAPDISSLLGSASLFGGAGTVVLDHVGDAHRDMVSRILDAPFAPGARLILLAGELGKTSKLRRMHADSDDMVAVPFYLMEDHEIANFARNTLQAMDMALSRDAGAALATRLSGDRALTTRACETLALHALGHGRREITHDDVIAMLSGVDESAYTAPLDQALLGSHGPALAHLHARLAEGTSSVALLRAFSARLFRLRAMHDSGLSAKDAVAKAKPPVFWKERALVTRLLGKTTHKIIDRTLLLIDRAEYDMIERGAPHGPRMGLLVTQVAHRLWEIP